MAKNVDEAMLETLLSYKTMALDYGKHDVMLKDKTVLQFLAYSLDSEDNEIIEASLKTVELLVHNNKNHRTLKSTFGVTEALKATSERNGVEIPLKSLAKELYLKLEDAPAYFTRSQTAKLTALEDTATEKKKLTSKLHSFHVFGLNEDTHHKLESAVVKIPGVISVVVDKNHQRCQIRMMETVTPQKLVESIARLTKLEARLILRNKLRQEVLVELDKNEYVGSDYAFENEDLPDYLPENESPVKEKAVYAFDRLRTSAASWVRSATSLFQRNLYW